MRRMFFLTTLFGLLAGCKTEHKIETTSTVAIQPIQITMDINLNVKVDKALDDFFSDLD